ncbi:MAG TPA: hypothetical protein VH643_03820 [Gemmataceae bacterium]|jgi:WD40 repeat protein
MPTDHACKFIFSGWASMKWGRSQADGRRADQLGAFGPDVGLLASASADRTIQVWDVRGVKAAKKD